jgi:hyaluronan synthase
VTAIDEIPDLDLDSPRGGSMASKPVRILGVVILVGLNILLFWHLCERLLDYGKLGMVSLVYTTLIGFYLISRFILAAFYRKPPDVGFFPDVAVIIPAFNEGRSILRSIEACLGQDYPEDKLRIICIDDGSTDDTFVHMQLAEIVHGDRLTCVSLGQNRGKRAAMAEGVRRTESEICVFVDSDSEPAPDGIAKIVQGFVKDDVGAISGLTHARNADENNLTRMQAARYFISFQMLKASESVLGAVVCCSGCFSAYRRASIAPLLEPWEAQTFLGAPCTFGDDRSLTNMVVRSGYRTIYHSGALAWTEVPSDYRGFFRQQQRWKKSWLRESPIFLSHVWRSRPLAFPSSFVTTLAAVVSPIVLIVNLFVYPALGIALPLIYLLGLFLIASAYGIFHRILADNNQWKWAVIGTGFYVVFAPQMFWALARVRDGSWGTRAA